nr:VanW family protein [Saccharomonospora saliphila]
MRRPAVIAAAVFGFLVLLYGFDLLVTNGDVPRGVSVAGVDVGGMSHNKAEGLLREEIEPRLSQPVGYTAGETEGEFDPKQAGLRLDWDATLDQAGDQPLNPFTRIASFFSDRELGVVTDAEPNQFDNAMKALRQDIDQEPVEGNVVFEGAEPKPVEPKQGQALDVEAAKDRILAHWASGTRLTLPVESTPVTITSEKVRAALTEVAEPAVSAPVVVRGEGDDGELTPEEIAAGLSFEAKDGELVPRIDQKKIVEGVEPDLAETEQEGRDAEIVFEGGRPTVEPSQDGNQINWDKTLEPLPDVLATTDSGGRELKAHYEKQPAEITTEEAEQLGIKEVIGEFTTGGFAPDSGVNIRVVAEEVNGAIVKPGETFSLNEYTGPRGKPQGYVEAGIIENGAPGTAVGGGISQFATTLYNAYYFAGLKDAGHREHSYYISRYPEGREATVFQNPDGSSVIDLRFTNNTDTGVAIQTIWTPNDITVKLWGTKHYEVESITGDRTDFVEPGEAKGPEENCKPSGGQKGFTVTNTRVIKDASTGEVIRKEPRTVTYKKKDKIVCPKDD